MFEKKWKKLEKFWVDMNNLTISPHFFDKIVQGWPQLRTLDLYDNNIHLDVSNVMKLKRLPLLHLVQLQNNRLFGRVDSSFFEDWPRNLRQLNLNLNSELQGCIHPRLIPSWLRLFVSGTQIKISYDCSVLDVDGALLHPELTTYRLKHILS